jgi:hypothetical protein
VADTEIRFVEDVWNPQLGQNIQFVSRIGRETGSSSVMLSVRVEFAFLLACQSDELPALFTPRLDNKVRQFNCGTIGLARQTF